jgi:hypothetical protein
MHAGITAITELAVKNGLTIFVAKAHRREGKRFVVHADEKLTAFMELESVTRAWGELS